MNDPTAYELITDADIRALVIALIVVLISYVTRRAWSFAMQFISDRWAQRSRSSAIKRITKLETNLHDLEEIQKRPAEFVASLLVGIGNSLLSAMAAIGMFISSGFLLSMAVVVKENQFFYFTSGLGVLLFSLCFAMHSSSLIARVERLARPDLAKQYLLERINRLRDKARLLQETEK